MRFLPLLALVLCSPAYAANIRITDWDLKRSYVFAACKPTETPHRYSCTARFNAHLPEDGPQWRRGSTGLVVTLEANNLGSHMNQPLAVSFEKCSLVFEDVGGVTRFDCRTGLGDAP